jgi:hypothetical protein
LTDAMPDPRSDDAAPSSETQLERVRQTVQEMLADSHELTATFRDKENWISVTIDVIPEGGRRSRPFVAPVPCTMVEPEAIRERIIKTAREYADLQTHPDCAVQVFLHAVDAEAS